MCPKNTWAESPNFWFSRLEVILADSIANHISITSRYPCHFLSASRVFPHIFNRYNTVFVYLWLYKHYSSTIRVLYKIRRGSDWMESGSPLSINSACLTSVTWLYTSGTCCQYPKAGWSRIRGPTSRLLTCPCIVSLLCQTHPEIVFAPTGSWL